MVDTLRILYVDDEPDLLEIGKLFLEQYGDFIVTTIGSAPAALDLLIREQFDAIISDYQMPGLDGIQFLIEVRKKLGQVPFILFTGKGREEVVIQAINSGADFYLQKGGEPGAQFAELSHKIKQAALRNKAENSLRKSEEKYRLLIEHANEAIVVAQDGRLKLVNKRAIEVTGYSEQELLSMPFSDIVNPADRAIVMERYQKRLKSEELPSRYPFRVGSKEGSTYWVELSAVVIDWDGRPATLNFLSDVTKRKKAEEALQESESFNRGLVENLPDYIIVYRPDEKILYVNPATVKAFGYTAEELAGTSVLSYVAPECRNEVTATITARLEGRDPPEYETVIISANGQRKTVIAKGTLIHYHDGPATLLVLNDITGRKQADELLRISEEKYRKVFFTSPDSICITRLHDGMFVSVNKGFTEITGYTEEDIAGKTSLEINIWKDPEDRRKIVEGLTAHGEVRDYEASFLTKTGEICGVMSTSVIELNGVPHILNITRDITRHKRAEETFRMSVERYKIISEMTTDFVFSCIKPDNGTYSIDWMAGAVERITGYTIKELIALGCWKCLVLPEDTLIFDENVTNLPAGTSGTCILRIQTKRGDTRWLEVHTSNNSSYPNRIFGGCRDITERKVAEEARQRSEEKHRLLIENSHDIIYTIDTEGLFIFVSPSWKEHLGHPVDQVIGKPFAQFVHPEDIIRCLQFMRNVFSTGKPQTGIEYRVKHIDGSWRWHITNAVPLQDEAGTIVGGEGSASDITERKYFENEMKSHEQELMEFSTSLATANKKLNLLSSITRHDINNQLTILKGYLTILEKSNRIPLTMSISRRFLLLQNVFHP